MDYRLVGSISIPIVGSVTDSGCTACIDLFESGDVDSTLRGMVCRLSVIVSDRNSDRDSSLDSAPGPRSQGHVFDYEKSPLRLCELVWGTSVNANRLVVGTRLLGGAPFSPRFSPSSLT